MKKLILGVVALGVITVSAYAYTGFLVSEQEAGMNKFCFYDNDTVITVKSYQLCPLSNN